MYTYVYMLCVTLCIRSMYNIYIRRRLERAASLTNVIIYIASGAVNHLHDINNILDIRNIDDAL